MSNFKCLYSYFVTINLLFGVIVICDEGGRESELATKLYKQLFVRQRKEQLYAIKNFQKLTNYDKQYSTIKLMSEKIFDTIMNSRVLLESSPFIPGVSEFPEDEETREALSNVLENTALFCELVLRFPDVSSKLLKQNNSWNLIFQWGIAFSHQLNYLLDKSTKTVLKLVAQELNHTERDPNYVNPYRKTRIKSENVKVTSIKEKKKKKVIKKGPKLSSHDEF